MISETEYYSNTAKSETEKTQKEIYTLPFPSKLSTKVTDDKSKTQKKSNQKNVPIEKLDNTVESNKSETEITSEVLAKKILNRLRKNVKPPDKLIQQLVLTAANILSKEDNVIELSSPVIVVGDIHGQWDDLEQLFSQINFNISAGFRILFLGDYVDRGLYSIECLSRLLALKLLYPDYIYLLRGNHEDLDSNDIYGLSTECSMYYSLQTYLNITTHLWPSLPLCAVIDSKLFCVHGGIPLFQTTAEAQKKYQEIKILPRIALGASPTRFALAPAKLSAQLLQHVNLVQDLLWSDPASDENNQPKLFRESERGMGKIWSQKATKVWNKANGFTHIIRGHQVVNSGIFYSHQKKVITVFSASMYCGLGNAASILKIWAPGTFEAVSWKITGPSVGLFGKKEAVFSNPYFM